MSTHCSWSVCSALAPSQPRCPWRSPWLMVAETNQIGCFKDYVGLDTSRTRELCEEEKERDTDITGLTNVAEPRTLAALVPTALFPINICLPQMRMKTDSPGCCSAVFPFCRHWIRHTAKIRILLYTMASVLGSVSIIPVSHTSHLLPQFPHRKSVSAPGPELCHDQLLSSSMTP